MGSNGKRIGKAVIGDALTQITKKKRSVLKGLYFGSCKFITKNTAQYLLMNNKHSIDWVAGYSENIEWISSLALDFIFWNKFYDNYDLHKTAKYLNKNMLGLCKSLGFSMYEIGEENKLINLINS